MPSSGARLPVSFAHFQHVASGLSRSSWCQYSTVLLPWQRGQQRRTSGGRVVDGGESARVSVTSVSMISSRSHGCVDLLRAIFSNCLIASSSLVVMLLVS